MRNNMVRTLRQGLIVSGAINILLATALFYFWLKPLKFSVEMPTLPKAPLTTEERATAGDLLVKWSTLPYPALVDKLQSTLPVEWGYAERDFALALLLSRHHFDLSRALPGHASSRRTLLFKGETLYLYPSLTDAHYSQVVQFATREQWPVTTEGLYSELKKDSENISLRTLFMATPEYKAIERSFIQADELVSLLLKEDWNHLLEMSKQPLSSRDRQKFLIEKIQKQDVLAARLLVKTDLSFVVKQLDDPTILQLMTLLGKEDLAITLSRELLKTPRSDAVWGVARTTLPAEITKEIAKPLVSPLAKAKPLPKRTTVGTVQQPQPKATRGEILYVVQEGDTLWQIARKYRAEVGEIRKRNALTTDGLKPGKIIKIPG